jgi:hypothetical protein
MSSVDIWLPGFIKFKIWFTIAEFFSNSSATLPTDLKRLSKRIYLNSPTSVSTGDVTGNKKDQNGNHPSAYKFP